MNILTLETTCDETAAAVITDRLEVLGLGGRFPGRVAPALRRRGAGDRLAGPSGAHPAGDRRGPAAGRLSLGRSGRRGRGQHAGLAGSLLVGLVAAKALCVALDIPLVAVNHLQAHIYACRLAAAPQEVFPCVGLIVSGGHTSLYRCRGPLDFELLGGTIDDAAGEAFDKVAAMLGLPYPGGPAIARAAAAGNPRGLRSAPRVLRRTTSGLDFSFSGLKTAVRYTIVGPGQPDFSRLRTHARGKWPTWPPAFRRRWSTAWWTRRLRRCGRPGLRILCVGGGVAANARLRQRLARGGRPPRRRSCTWPRCGCAPTTR